MAASKNKRKEYEKYMQKVAPDPTPDFIDLNLEPESQAGPKIKLKITKKEQILNSIDETLNEMSEYEDYRTIKVLYFIGVLMISVVGIVLIFYALGISILFEAIVPESSTTRIGLIAAGSCLFVPMLSWLVYVFCPPCKKEQERRKVLETKRSIRARLEKNRYAYQWSTTDPDDVEAENRALAQSIKDRMDKKVGNTHDDMFPEGAEGQVKIKKSIKLPKR